MAVTTVSLVSLLLLTAALGGPGAISAADLPEHRQRWLEEEAVYIISQQERAEFLALADESEREDFVRRFWRIRDPDPSTEINEFRLEHGRRIEVANRKFHDGAPGWKTDRGRVYIMHGPPDDVSFTYGGDGLSVNILNPTQVLTGGAGSQDRRRSYRMDFVRPETEIWIYRHIPGASGVTGYFQVIFSRVDPNQLHQLHQTMRGVGSGLRASYPARVARDNAILHFFSSQHVTGRYRILYAGEYKFADIDAFYQSIFHPDRVPSFSMTDMQIALRDLERSPGEVLQEKLRRKSALRQQVETRISFEQFEADLRFGSVRSESGGTHLLVTLGIGPECANDELDLLLELVRRDGSIAASVVDFFPIPKRKANGAASGSFLYQTRLGARPGSYKLRVYGHLKGRKSVYFAERPVQLPEYGVSQVGMSDLLLFDEVIPRAHLGKTVAGRFLGGSSPVLLKDFALLPAAKSNFRRRDLLTAFFEVYNPGIRPDRKEPSLTLSCRVWNGDALVASLPDKALDYITQNKVSGAGLRQTTYGLSIPMARLRPGRYALELAVHDAVLNQTVSRKASFRVY